MSCFKPIPVRATLIIGLAMSCGLATLAVAQAPLGREGKQQSGQYRPVFYERMRQRGGMEGRQHPGAHAGDWLRRYGRLSPEEQNRALAGDPQFQQLPPERQQRLRERLQQFNSLPPERRQQIMDRMEVFEHLPPEQKEKLRQFSEQFRQMPEERRRMMHHALKNLREMSPQERERVLASPRFSQNFSPQEIEILRGMSAFQPPSFGDRGRGEGGERQQQPNEPPREE
jgi:hypothetical protein